MLEWTTTAASPRRTHKCLATVRVVDPLTSSGPPSLAEVVEHLETTIKLRAHCDLRVGTLVQLDVEQSSSLWTVSSSVEYGDAFLLALELTTPARKR